MTEEQRKNRNAKMVIWKRENRDRINLLFTKGIKEEVEDAASAAGVSKSKWVEEAIKEKLERDGY